MTMMVSRRALMGGFALGGAGLILPGAALASASAFLAGLL